MSSDDSDKTVFRKTPDGQASSKGDRTVIKPTPGRRSGQTQVPRPAEPMQHSGGGRPVQQASYAAYANPGSAQFKTQYGLNPVVNAASMLIAVFYKTKNTVSHPNVGGLHQQLIAAIRTFEDTANQKAISPEIVLAARYVICAA